MIFRARFWSAYARQRQNTADVRPACDRRAARALRPGCREPDECSAERLWAAGRPAALWSRRGAAGLRAAAALRPAGRVRPAGGAAAGLWPTATLCSAVLSAAALRCADHSAVRPHRHDAGALRLCAGSAGTRCIRRRCHGRHGIVQGARPRLAFARACRASGRARALP